MKQSKNQQTLNTEVKTIEKIVPPKWQHYCKDSYPVKCKHCLFMLSNGTIIGAFRNDKDGITFLGEGISVNAPQGTKILYWAELPTF